MKVILRKKSILAILLAICVMIGFGMGNMPGAVVFAEEGTSDISKEDEPASGTTDAEGEETEETGKLQKDNGTEADETEENEESAESDEEEEDAETKEADATEEKTEEKEDSMPLLKAPLKMFGAARSTGIELILDNITGGYSEDAAGGKIELSTDGSNFSEIDSFFNALVAANSGDGVEGTDNGKKKYSFPNLSSLYLKLTPKSGNNANLLMPGGTAPTLDAGGVCVLSSGTYHIEFNNSTPGGGPAPEYMYTFKLNGVTFTDVKGGDSIKAPANFNLSSLSFRLLEVNFTDGVSYKDFKGVDDAGAYYSSESSENLGRYEVKFNDSMNGSGTNYRVLNIECNAVCYDPTPAVKAEHSFYIRDVKIYKDDFKGILVDKEGINWPDMFDWANFNEVDLHDTSEGSPAQLEAYYADPSIKLAADDAGAGSGPVITEIEVLRLPDGVATVSGTIVTVHSQYYDVIPLKVTLSDGTTGYIDIVRKGIQINDWGPGANGGKPAHGASGIGAPFPAQYQANTNITAVFYHDVNDSDTAYQMVATITHHDGTIETKIVDSYGGTPCNSNSMPGATPGNGTRGSDYIIWSGDGSEPRPQNVAVTAIPAGAMDNTSSFGGCAFGAGAGVQWK